MPFTQQQEDQIIQHMNSLPDDEKQKHSQNIQTALTFVSGYLGKSAIDYAINKHGWPAVERKIMEIWMKLRL